MQDQLDVLPAKFDSIYTNQEHWPFGHSDQKGGDKGECLFEGEKSQKLFLSFFFLCYLCLCFG